MAKDVRQELDRVISRTREELRRLERPPQRSGLALGEPPARQAARRKTPSGDFGLA